MYPNQDLFYNIYNLIHKYNLLQVFPHMMNNTLFHQMLYIFYLGHHRFHNFEYKYYYYYHNMDKDLYIEIDMVLLEKRNQFDLQILNLANLHKYLNIHFHQSKNVY